ncbi:hypothetical protein PR048_024055 [Dryococelus australis]|uniref:Uncharacterized protein n=1 Tax=Dryococelus australis TaxID=614101 RepID=A0ABQ9GVU3_9NEOP|nr:hypothetical protein PR048_024055 [Dryococelus australis]
MIFIIKLEDYLHEYVLEAYTLKHIKHLILDKYGENIIIGKVHGIENVITFRETAKTILHKFYQQAKDDNFGKTPVITFDQPLYWKTQMIINSEPSDSPLRCLVVLIGGFHTRMSYPRCIGALIEYAALLEILQIAYPENTVRHILSGKAVSRAICAHNMVGFALNIILLMEIYGIQIHEARQEGKLGYLNEVKIIFNDLLNDTCSLKDRTGDWTMHLKSIRENTPYLAAAGHNHYTKATYIYLQQMTGLGIEHPDIHHEFHEGKFVVRRSDRFCAGLSSDLVIEQSLMRSLKGVGGLAHA